MQNYSICSVLNVTWETYNCQTIYDYIKDYKDYYIYHYIFIQTEII